MARAGALLCAATIAYAMVLCAAISEPENKATIRRPTDEFHWDDVGEHLNSQFNSSEGLEVVVGELLDSVTPKVSWDVAWEDLGSTHSTPDAASSNAALQHVLQCFNEKVLKKEMTWESATSIDGGGIAGLKVVGGWWSPQSAATSHIITLVTSGSLDRLPQLHAQCKAWQGPLSAVLFLGLVQDTPWPLSDLNRAALRNAIFQVSRFMAAMHKTSGICQPSILLAYEVYTDPTAVLLYPVNILRNYARIQAHTPLIAMLDVDLLPSRTLFARFADSSSTELVKQVQQKVVLVLPAFDLTHHFEMAPWAEALVSSPTKDIMVTAMDRDLVTPFHMARFAVGHRMTNFSRWRNATKDYNVQYEEHCEPWVIGHRLLMPWHDARYRGFGFNKMQHVNSLKLDGFKFRVLHDVYTIHRPHDVVEAKHHFLMRTSTKPAHESRLSLRQHVEALYESQAELGKSQKYQAMVSPAELNCRAKLPWWNGPKARRLANAARVLKQGKNRL